MSTYQNQDFDAKTYNAARPTYPDQFYETLVEYHKARGCPTKLALDVGCGPGFVAYKLLNYFDSVVGTDFSQTMIDQCNSDPRAKNTDKIRFLQAPAEQAPPEIKELSVDLVTAAEACHWFDHPKFFKECARILKPRGTLAYWFYFDPVFVGNKKATDLVIEYSYDSSKEKYGDSYERFFGPYFDQPGHDIFRTTLADINPPSSDFTDLVRHYYHPLENSGGPEFTSLYIEREISLNTFRNQAKSWSGYHNWKKANPDKPDAADELIDKLAEALKVDLDTPLKVVFPTVYTFARRKSDE